MIEFKWHVYIKVEMCLRIYMTLFIVPRIAFDASNIAGAVLWVINFLLRLKTNNCIYRKTCLGSSWRHLCITLFFIVKNMCDPYNQVLKFIDHIKFALVIYLNILWLLRQNLVYEVMCTTDVNFRYKMVKCCVVLEVTFPRLKEIIQYKFSC